MSTMKTGEQYPVLSIVVPSHNVEPWIDELLGSILNQDIDFEVIVVDDHSSDGTRARLHSLASADARILLIDADGRGGANARNVGLAAARGHYVAFADADDIVPPGAYRALVESLESSGSDIAFGDYLKFSSTRTWQPSKNWKSFEATRMRLRLTDEPNLIRGRAVWNKVFRRSFLERLGLEFPEVVRSNDIVPMTRAYVAAQLVDVVAECVYLYRDRPGVSSMTSRAGAAAAASSYFSQEAECAGLVTGVDDEQLSAVYSALVFDADSWVHLSRFLLGLPDDEDVDADALAAALLLIDRTPKRGLLRAAGHKQILWALVTAGELGLARRFNSAEEVARAAGEYDARAIEVWCEALSMLADPAGPGEMVNYDRIAEGFFALLAHHAKQITPVELSVALSRLNESATTRLAEVPLTHPVLSRMAAPAVIGDAIGVRVVSTHRTTPLVTDTVSSVGKKVQLSGGTDQESGTAARIFAVQRRARLRVPLGEARVIGGRWGLNFSVGMLAAGRWEVVVEYSAGGGSVEMPVVTARMPLPVITRADRVRVLADRQQRWRMILEVRPPASVRAVRRVGRRVRSVLR